MRKFIHLKITSTLLLLVILAVTLSCAHESAHALQSPVNTAFSAMESAASHDTPCPPCEHHQDYDGCDSCVNCACHASLTVQPFQLSYNPIIVNLSRFDLFKHLPEVHLSKFIPPQIQA